MGKILLGILLGIMLMASGAFAANGDLIVDGNLGVGAMSPLYKTDIRTPGSVASQVHISSTDTDAGGYITSASDSNMNISSGAAWNGTSWVAKSTNVTILNVSNGNLKFSGATGLTVGDSFTETPYRLFTVSSSGNVGIGTATPISPLQISRQNANGNSLLINNSAGYGSLLADGSEAMLARIISTNIIQLGDINARYLSLGLITNGTYKLFIDQLGNVGIGTTNPSYPLHMASGARVTTGGVWTNASSREYKDNIAELSASQALAAVRELNPVTFTYKVDANDKHVGFIAEDVPNLVATPDRKSLSAMDIVAVLTKVVQEQQKEIEKLKSDMAKMKAKDMVSGVYSR